MEISHVRRAKTEAVTAQPVSTRARYGVSTDNLRTLLPHTLACVHVCLSTYVHTMCIDFNEISVRELRAPRAPVCVCVCVCVCVLWLCVCVRERECVCVWFWEEVPTARDSLYLSL